MTNAIWSTYLVSHLPLKARSGLLKSLLSHLKFFAIVVGYVTSDCRVNRQINWGIKVCHLRKKFDSARDLLSKDKFLPADLFIKNVCFLKFLTSQYKESSQETPHSGFFGKCELTKNSTTIQFFPKKKCQFKWYWQVTDRNFSRKWNNLPIEIRKTKNKFKEKLSSEMVKLHDRVPIDRQERGFKNFFYWSIKTKLFIYLRGNFKNVNI